MIQCNLDVVLRAFSTNFTQANITKPQHSSQMKKYPLSVTDCFFCVLFLFLQTYVCEGRVILCCYQAFNVYYYKYTVQGISIFALSILLWVAGFNLI